MTRITHSDSMHRGDALGPFTQDQINLFRWLFRDGFSTITGEDGLAFLQLNVGGNVYLGASGDNSLNLTVNDETPGGGDDAKLKIIGGNGLVLPSLTADPAAGASEDGQIYYNSTSDVVRLRANGAWTDLAGSGGAPDTADYLVGTTQAGLSAEIVVGTTPGGELGNTWASPTVDATHSGSTHTDFIAKAIADAKGDLIAATAADTVARLPVGTDTFVLTADSAEATGLKWVTAGSPTLGAWTDFTPTWTGSVSNPAIGNGTLTGRYKALDSKTYAINIALTIGSTTTMGSGDWIFALPSVTSAAYRQTLACSISDSGTRRYVGSGVVGSSATTVGAIAVADASGTFTVGASVPITWATNDYLLLSGMIEVA